MLKAASKKRRSKAQIKEDKEQEELKKAAIEAKAAQFDALKVQNQMLQQQVQANQAASDILNEAVNQGHASVDDQDRLHLHPKLMGSSDQSSNIIVVDSSEQHSHQHHQMEGGEGSSLV